MFLPFLRLRRTREMDKIVLFSIPEHPTYFATKNGDIYSLKENGSFHKMATKSRTGYAAICFRDGKPEREYVHRIIAKMFVDNPLNKPEVDHIDTNRSNNSASNLRWVDRKENSNNPISIEKYARSNREKARARFLFSDDVIPVDLNPMDNLEELLKSLSVGSIYRISHDYYKHMSITSKCSKMKKEGYGFKVLNYSELNYTMIRRTK